MALAKTMPLKIKVICEIYHIYDFCMDYHTKYSISHPIIYTSFQTDMVAI